MAAHALPSLKDSFLVVNLCWTLPPLSCGKKLAVKVLTGNLTWAMEFHRNSAYFLWKKQPDPPFVVFTTPRLWGDLNTSGSLLCMSSKHKRRIKSQSKASTFTQFSFSQFLNFKPRAGLSSCDSFRGQTYRRRTSGSRNLVRKRRHVEKILLQVWHI